MGDPSAALTNGLTTILQLTQAQGRMVLGPPWTSWCLCLSRVAITTTSGEVPLAMIVQVMINLSLSMEQTHWDGACSLTIPTSTLLTTFPSTQPLASQMTVALAKDFVI